MIEDFSTYEAYQERYKMFYSEEGDQRPPILSQDEFMYRYQLLAESYEAYRQLLQMGDYEKAGHYYEHIINQLENQLAIADGSDNF